MSKNDEFDPFSNDLINENDDEDLISEDEIKEIISESDERELSHDLEFDEIFSFKSIKAKRSNQKSFIDSEDIQSDSEITELRSKEDESGKGKAEVLINRRNNGELESIEVVASNGERILINFEYDDEIEDKSSTENVEEEESNIQNKNVESKIVESETKEDNEDNSQDESDTKINEEE